MGSCVKEWIERVANISVDGKGNTPDVCMIELGGTVGDIERYSLHCSLHSIYMFAHCDHIDVS